jgi:hypothetical protein
VPQVVQAQALGQRPRALVRGSLARASLAARMAGLKHVRTNPARSSGPPIGAVNTRLPGSYGRLDHAGSAGQQVQPADPERDLFAGAQAGVGGEQHQRPVPRVDGVGERLDLVGVQEVHLVALPLGRLDAGCAVDGQAPALDR